MDSQKLLSLINEVVRRSGNWVCADRHESGAEWDRHCPSYEETKEDLNKVLSELWKAVSKEPEPVDLHVRTTKCELCDCWHDDSDIVGCCRDGECPERVDQMCDGCATWNEEKEQWCCEKCAEEKESDDEEYECYCQECGEVIEGMTEEEFEEDDELKLCAKCEEEC